MKLKCNCGCGGLVKWNNQHKRWNKYITNHHTKIKPRSNQHRINISLSHGGTGILKNKISILCYCGCKKITIPGNIYIKGHNRKGKEVTSKTKKLLSEQKIGNKNPSKKSEVRLKISNTLIGKCAKEKHYNWQGGISKEPYSQDWSQDLKDAIRKRDNYICQICTSKQEDLLTKLDIHHLDYDKENCNPDNLLSLCHSCHMKTNYHREKWITFFAGRKKLKEVI